MREFRLKKALPGLLAVLIGLAVAIFAWNALYQQTMGAQQTVQVVIPKHDIDAYSVVSVSDVRTKEVPPSVVDGFTVRKAGEIAGKVATAPLYAGKPIDKRMLAELSEDIGGWQVVGVNIDAARCAGVKKGDIVDVYWLIPEQDTQMSPQSSVLVAHDVRVLKVCDERGQEITQKSLALQEVVGVDAFAEREPRVVYLLVRPEDVPRVISGAAEWSAFLALARKPAPGKNAPPGTEVELGAENVEAGTEAGTGTAATPRDEPAGSR